MPKVIHRIKVDLKGGEASPGAKLAPLSSKGIKVIDICRDFNEKTKDKKGKIHRLQVLQYDDKSYETHIKGTPVSHLLMEMAQIEKGSSEPNRTKVATITQQQLQQIAEAKQKDINAFTLEAQMRTIAGTARSLGITIN